MDQNTFIEPSKITVAEYMHQWLDFHGQNLRAKTLERYKSLIELHIIPELGRNLLTKLAPVHLQNFYAKKIKGGRADGKEGGLSAASVRYLHNILHEALANAVNLGLISNNPAEKVKPPRVQQQEIRPFTEGEVKTFLNVAKGTKFEALFVTALGTGLRRGELLGLHWDEVNLEQGTLTVKYSLVNVKGRPVLQQPKTSMSKRTIALSSSVVESLKKHRVKQIQQKLRLGPLYQDQNLVFCSETGTPLNPENLIKRHFHPLLEKAGLPKIRFHDLRHTHATLLLAQGVNVKIISERLGHTDVGFTLKTYRMSCPTCRRKRRRSSRPCSREKNKDRCISCPSTRLVPKR